MSQHGNAIARRNLRRDLPDALLENQVFWIDRLGFAEDAFLRQPDLEASGAATRILVTAVETTDGVVGARRTSLIVELGARRIPGAGEGGAAGGRGARTPSRGHPVRLRAAARR